MRSLLVLLFFLIAEFSEGQTRMVNGIVVESYSKEPLIGVIVYNPQTKTIVNTDFYGKFSVDILGYGSTHLYINYTGYECKIHEVRYNEEFVEINLEEGQGIPPMRIIEYKSPNRPVKTPVDSISLLCNKYQHEVDSLLSENKYYRK